MEIVNICAPGYWDTADSYGIIACQMARHLAGMGVHVNAYALGGVTFGNQDADIRAITERPLRPALGGILLGYPTGYYRHGALTAAGPRIAVTMFESSRIPGDWTPIMNRCDAVVTPSTFGRDIFRECGVTVPIHVIPLGIADVYQPAPRDPNRPLTFLAFLDRGPRKGGMAALNAFVAAFGDRDDVRLILKARNQRRMIEITNPNVTVIMRDLTEAELYMLYLSADVLIAPTTGEGFGLIPREFAATGGVALATNWSGTADDIDLWGVPLDYTLVPARWDSQSLAGHDLGVWAQVSRDSLIERLRDVADNRTEYTTRAAENAQRVAAFYTWRKFAAGVWDVWKDAANGISHRHRTLAA